MNEHYPSGLMFNWLATD